MFILKKTTKHKQLQKQQITHTAVCLVRIANCMLQISCVKWRQFCLHLSDSAFVYCKCLAFFCCCVTKLIVVNLLLCKKMPIVTKKAKLEKADKLDEAAAQQEMEKENKDAELGLRRSTRLSRNTRSMAEDGPLSPEPVAEKMPYIKYKGAIKYYTDGNEIAETSDAIIQWIDKQTDKEIIPLAFDMEWPFSFQTGSGKTSVIQVCVDERCCYVFQLTKLKKLPAALVALLKHPKTRLHGVNIKNDFRKLARDFPEVNAEDFIAKCVELGTWCNEVHATGGRWSLERLCNFICKLSMDKNKKVRMSKWHVMPLDENQLMYAAIDVYIGQVIYRKLEESAKQKLQNETEFKAQNGEEAYKAMKALGETFLGPNMELKK